MCLMNNNGNAIAEYTYEDHHSEGNLNSTHDTSEETTACYDMPLVAGSCSVIEMEQDDSSCATVYGY